jgi:2-polyprenyl-3-methyl-5-hydroxy-6-metoxy-1,4-benzoquinol methylase
MPVNETDHDWEKLANQDAYWSVLTEDRFRKEAINEDFRREFFSTGESYIEWIFSMIRAHLDSQFNPKAGLDFGCGVGRLVLPMGRRCHTVTGIDVSDTMLQEARKNCEREGLTNIHLVKGDDDCSSLKPGFDFINSFIVFQHIPCARGVNIFRKLVGLLNPDGVGAIQVTYSRSYFSINPNTTEYKPLEDETPRTVRYYLAGVKRAARNSAAKMFGSKPPASSSPVMQMNPYLLNPLFQILHEAGVRQMHVAFSCHDVSLGAVLFFKKGPGAFLIPPLG